MEKNSRIRRSKKTRAKIRELGGYRLSVHRSSQHIYAQVFNMDDSKVVASASTLDADVKSGISGNTGNKNAATAVGKMVAERAKAAGVDTVSFDRSGFRYHGRIKALADSAREAGLKF